MPETLKNFARVWGVTVKRNEQNVGYGILKKNGDSASKTYDNPLTPIGREKIEAPSTTHTLCFVGDGVLHGNDVIFINGRKYRVLQTEPIYYKEGVIFYHKVALFFIELPEGL